jgi:hypothetical protein
MKVAFIAPSLITEYVCSKTDYQLCLPRPLELQTDYFDFYRKASGNGHHVILDNGAAEGELVNPQELLEAAAIIKPAEVVIPDVMKDVRATLSMAKQFDLRYGDVPAEWNYIGVAQGETVNEVMSCVDGLVNFDLVTTIALPKHLCKTLDDPNARVKLARFIREEYKQISIHCLGSDPSAIMEVAALASDDIVRGIDTSMPVFCGLWGFDIKRDNIAGARRPAEYFSYYVTDEEMVVVERNIETFLEWASNS